MYNEGDESYKNQPYQVSAATVSAPLNLVKTHCLAENLQDVHFSSHGGEPVLAGRDFFRQFVSCACAILG